MIMVFMVWVGDNDMIIDEGVTKKRKILRTLLVILGVKNGISLSSFRSPIAIAINIILILINPPLYQHDIMILLNAETSWASK